MQFRIDNKILDLTEADLGLQKYNEVQTCLTSPTFQTLGVLLLQLALLIFEQTLSNIGYISWKDAFRMPRGPMIYASLDLTVPFALLNAIVDDCLLIICFVFLLLVEGIGICERLYYPSYLLSLF